MGCSYLGDLLGGEFSKLVNHSLRLDPLRPVANGRGTDDGDWIPV